MNSDRWDLKPLGDIVEVLDHKRVPVSAKERAGRAGAVPYYGATGRVGWIDAVLFDEPLLLLGEDGVQFFDRDKPKAYLIDGPSWVNNHAHVLRVRSDVVDRRFLLHQLNWLDYQGYANGTTRLKLTKSAMTRLPVLLPKLADQRRIVETLEDHLSRLDAARASLVTARKRLVSWRRSVLDDVVSRNASASGSLREVIDRVEAGRSFGGSAPPAREGQWGVVKVSAMTWGRFQPDENKEVSGERIDSRFEIRCGDVLVSRANTTEYVGAAVLVEETPPRRLLSDKSLRLVPKVGVEPRWLVAALSAPSTRQQISAGATGTKDSMRNISQQSLLSVTVPIASGEEQARVVASMRLTDELGAAMEDALVKAERRTDSLRRGLLATAFSGCLTASPRSGESVEEATGV